MVQVRFTLSLVWGRVTQVEGIVGRGTAKIYIGSGRPSHSLPLVEVKERQAMRTIFSVSFLSYVQLGSYLHSDIIL